MNFYGVNNKIERLTEYVPFPLRNVSILSHTSRSTGSFVYNTDLNMQMKRTDRVDDKQ